MLSWKRWCYPMAAGYEFASATRFSKLGIPPGTQSRLGRDSSICEPLHTSNPSCVVLVCEQRWGAILNEEEATMREPNPEMLNALVGKMVGDLGISLGGASILLG